MASINFVVLESGVRKQKVSSTSTIDFQSIRIGASNLEILEAAGHFDFSNKKLTNVANPTAAQDVATKDYVDNSTGNAANKTLSNLTSPTAVNQDLMPNADNTRNIGSNSSRWASITGDFVSASSSMSLRDTSGNPLLGFSTTTVAGYNGPFLRGPSIAGYTGFGMAGRDQAAGSYPLLITTGGASAGNSGDLIARTGTASGVRGEFSIQTRQTNLNSTKIVNLADPTSAQDAATKNYVDIVAQGIKPKQAVRVATTGSDISLDQTTTAVDGVTLVTGDRVLVKDQTLPSANGIWVASTTGPWVRALDFDATSPVDEINGAWVGVQQGTANAGKVFVQYGTVATVGTDPITFTYFNDMSTLIGGDMITVLGSTVSVDLSSTGGLESTNPGNAAGQLRIKLEDTSLALSASGVKVNIDNNTLELDSTLKVKEHRSFTNDNAGSITVRQVVYIKSNGAVDLARADVSALENGYIGLVQDASIATTASGKVTVKPGALISGFSGLTPGAKQYVSRATAGALTESLAGFVTNEVVYSVGYALSATEIVYQPQFEYVY